MVSKRLKNLFFVTLTFIYLHGVEEVTTNFPETDSFMKVGGKLLNTTSENFYWIFHFAWWILLPMSYLLFHKKKVALFLFSLFGLFFIVELHHIIKAFYFRSYYPGLITALIYPFIGVAYWKELTASWRKYGKKSS